MPFSKLGLSEPLVKAVTELGYVLPTKIQQKAIPVILEGRDLIAAAQTGTGKTASFVLPILESLRGAGQLRGKRIRALILTPTRELAVQVEASVRAYGKHLSLTSMAMYGGVDPEPQKQQLYEGVDVLVATPGRLLDMAHQRALHFDELKVLVLDEADKMLDMGFIADINKIIERLPQQRQNLLFSATLSDSVRLLAKTAIRNPVELAMSARSAEQPKIDQWLITVDKDKKSALLSHLILEQNWTQALIFIETKHGSAKLVAQLGKRGIAAEAFHSGRSQAVREQLMADFKSGALKFLVATGVAARGLDIDQLPRVVNYDLPFETDDYIHRIGRTGRAGAAGEAISFVSRDDFKNLCAIERRLGQLIVRKEIEGFAPMNEVPVSILNFVPKSQVARKKSGEARAPSPERKPRSPNENKRPAPGKIKAEDIWGKKKPER